jgi:hypothetical protein
MLNHCTHAALLRDSQRLPLCSVVPAKAVGWGGGGVKAARAGKENCDPARRPGRLEEQVGPRTDFEQWRRDAAGLLLCCYSVSSMASLRERAEPVSGMPRAPME